MKIVIEIEEDYYEIIKHEVEHGHDFKPYNLIANGTPLPRHHGRLIDADALEYEPYLVSKGNGMYEEVNGYFNIDNAPTIIEGSDKE